VNESLVADVMLWAHAMATSLMAGLIWFVQIVHYPLFARVGADGFFSYEREHQARTGMVVGPLMLVEAGSSAFILFAGATPNVPGARGAAIVGFGLVLAIWASTAFVQIPLHRRLEEGFDAQAIRSLVATNWLRTIAWTARVPIALWLLVA